MDIVKKAYEVVKKVLKSRKTHGVIAVVIGLVYFRRAAGAQILKVKLSYFIGALAQGLISEVVVNGAIVTFKSKSTNTWYQTNANLLTKNALFSLLSYFSGKIISGESQDLFIRVRMKLNQLIILIQSLLQLLWEF